MPTNDSNQQIDRAAADEAAFAKHRLELDGELSQIFEEKGAEKRDMTRLEQVRHSAFKKFLVGLTVFFAVMAAIAWAGVFFFTPAAGRFDGEGVELEVEGPTSVKSGERVTYALRYKNGEDSALGTASLELRYPKTFTVLSMDPQPDDAGVWRIGSIAPDKEGLITVEGVFIEQVGRELDMQGILSYRPADFNSEFQKVGTKGVTVADSVLDVTVTGPAKVLPGDKATLTVSYENDSDNTFEKLRLRVTYPEGFIPESPSPAASNGSMTEWDIARLESGAEGKVTVVGSFASDAEGSREAKATLGFLDANDAFAAQAEGAFAMDVLKGDFVSMLILNGKSGPQPLRFGDTLRFAVSYKNTGKVPMGDVSLAVKLESSAQGTLVNWNALEDSTGGVRNGDVITWTKKQIPSLGKIDAGDEGVIDFEIPTIANPIANAADRDYQVTAALTAMIGSIDGDKADRQTKAEPIVAKFVSDATFAASASYFDEDGIPVGKGPIPPEVGEQTTYRVTWKVANDLHELNDLRISAKLPPNAAWTGFQSADAGDLRFDAAAEKMLWTLNWMPTDITQLEISFDVVLTPTADQKGKFPTLVEGAIFESVDKNNGYGLLLSAPPLTTAAEGDAAASGKGRVE